MSVIHVPPYNFKADVAYCLQLLVNYPKHRGWQTFGIGKPSLPLLRKWKEKIDKHPQAFRIGMRLRKGVYLWSFAGTDPYAWLTASIRYLESQKVVFPLKQFWKDETGTHDLWAEIRDGVKTSEWRDVNDFWCQRLLGKKFAEIKWGRMPLDLSAVEGSAVDLTGCLVVHYAWFTIGYPKGSVPRLEADITGLLVYGRTAQFEVKFTNVKKIVCGVGVGRP